MAPTKDQPDYALPAEIWTHIFDLAADEDVIFQYALPTSMAESAWFKNFVNKWALRSPREALNSIQERSYATKKAISKTCKLWRRLGAEFLFRCLFFGDPNKLRQLCEIMDNESGLGWWTRRIHITKYGSRRGMTIDELENALVSVIRHCPNLEIFIVDLPMANSFGPIIDTLATYCRGSLRTVHWDVPREALGKVIWALDSLPNILVAHISFDAPVTETLHLGSASDVTLSLPCLQQLSLGGFPQDFVEQAAGWQIPALRSLSIHCDDACDSDDQPDLLTFLAAHGASLVYLDIMCIPTFNVPKILDLCPSLTTFAFNLDWRSAAGEDDDGIGPAPLVSIPHHNITHIGCHGLLYAFGVGHAATYASVEPLRSHLIRRTNDRNFAALNRVNFPSLKCVRTLNRTVLKDLNAADGPEASCFERWERWWNQCSRQRVRLEDCTGNLLGTLPEDSEEEEEAVSGEEEQDEGEGDEFEDDDDEAEDDDDDDDDEDLDIEADEDGMGFKIKIPQQRDDGPFSELRQLVEECQKMSAEREEPQFMLPGAPWQMMGGLFP